MKRRGHGRDEGRERVKRGGEGGDGSVYNMGIGIWPGKKGRISTCRTFWTTGSRRIP
jgi:hypothetical protein